MGSIAKLHLPDNGTTTCLQDESMRYTEGDIGGAGVSVAAGSENLLCLE